MSLWLAIPLGVIVYLVAAFALGSAIGKYLHKIQKP